MEYLWGTPMQYNNTYALAVSRPFAEKYQLKKISDLVKVQQHVKIGFTREFTDHFFPPYQGAPLLRKDTVKTYPEIKTALEKLKGKITDDEMRVMNYKVGVEGESAEEAANEYLTKAGLLP